MNILNVKALMDCQSVQKPPDSCFPDSYQSPPQDTQLNAETETL